MAFSILYSIADEENKQSTMQVNVPQTTSFADVTIFASEMAKLIDPLISGYITRIGVAFSVSIPAGLASVASSISDVEEGAKFQWRTALGNFTSFRIPTFLDSLISPGSNAVDTGEANVAALIAATQGGIDLTAATPPGSGTIAPCDQREEDITTLVTAKEQFLSSRG